MPSKSAHRGSVGDGIRATGSIVITIDHSNRAQCIIDMIPMAFITQGSDHPSGDIVGFFTRELRVPEQRESS